MKIIHFPHPKPSQKCGVLTTENFIILTFSLPRVKRKEIIKTQNQ